MLHDKVLITYHIKKETPFHEQLQWRHPGMIAREVPSLLQDLLFLNINGKARLQQTPLMCTKNKCVKLTIFF